MSWRARRVQRVTTLGRGEMVVGSSGGAYLLPAGSPARAVPCVSCNHAVGGQPAELDNVVTSSVCPEDGMHLLAAAFLRHRACPRPDDADLAARIVRMLDHADLAG